MKPLLLVLIYVSLTATGHLLLKYGAIQQPQVINKVNVGFTVNLFIVLGILSWVSATFVWIKVLEQLPLHLAYSLTSINYILLPILAVFILKEPITSMHWIGISLIAVGVWLILSGQPNWLNLKS